MRMKPLTPENTKKSFCIIKRFLEMFLFIMLAIELVQEFHHSDYLTYFTIALSYIGAMLFIFANSYKYIGSITDSAIYQNQLEIVNFYDTFLGNILIPMIFLFNVDGVIFKEVTIKNLALAKQILLLVAFLSALFARYILRLAKKYSDNVNADNTYAQSNEGSLKFKLIQVLNVCNFELNFILCCIFAYIAVSFKWQNALVGDAAVISALLIAVCMLIFVGIEDKKHIRFICAVVLSVIFIALLILRAIYGQ